MAGGGAEQGKNSLMWTKGISTIRKMILLQN